MSRMAGVPEGQGGPVARMAFRTTKKRYGRVMDPVAITAHNPRVLAAYGMWEMGIEKANSVDQRLKDLAVMKASSVINCAWCLDFGSKEVSERGLSDDELRAIATHRESPLFSELDKLVLDYAEGLTRTPVEVSDELFAALREHLDEAQMVELTTYVALENHRSRFNIAFGLGSQGFRDGAVCAAGAPAPATAHAEVA